MQKFLCSEFQDIADNFIRLKEISSKIETVADAWINCLKNGDKIMFCGNGGSAADSQHLAAELVGRYKMERKSFNAVALTTDTSILTAIGNDYGYDEIFARQVEGIGKHGDIIIGLSTSGNSQNIIKAFHKAKEIGITTIAFTGQNGGKMKELSDYIINVPAQITNRIQEMHIAIGHLLCEITEKELVNE